MLVNVAVEGYLRDHARQASGPLTVAEGTTVEQVGRLIGLAPEIPRLVVVNNAKADPDQVVSDRDEVAFIPMVGGG